MARSCLNCRFSEPAIMDEDGEPVLQCRRFPPSTIVVDGVVLRHVTQVDEDDWCGEHAHPGSPPGVVVHVAEGFDPTAISAAITKGLD